MREINRLHSYPISRGRSRLRPDRAPADREIARQFDHDYFDGDRRYGYGGYFYRPHFWTNVAQDLRNEYGLRIGSKVLDIGSGKGFLLHDLLRMTPGLEVYGLEYSAYGLRHSMPDVRPFLVRGTADELPFRDGQFDLVLCINTIHNLPRDRCMQAVREIERVKKPGGYSYIQVDSWLTDEQRTNFFDWMLTAETYSDPDGWKRLFADCGYTGDYYWTLTE